MKLSERYAHLLENFDKLPDDVVIPTAVTAAATDTCRKNSRRSVARGSDVFSDMVGSPDASLVRGGSHPGGTGAAKRTLSGVDCCRRSPGAVGPGPGADQ